uniref:MARVEL domain-containing protein n=1 Tax=Graphocephala atropunctata TaxID=36148 RepID=A0A1B6KCF7_9HEMI
MADQGFPGQHTTTTTMTATSTSVQPELRYDPLYLRTLPGMLKVAQIALNFLGFLSIAISGNAGYSQASFFDSISGFAFWFSGFLLAFYLFHVIEKFYKIPWLKIELGFCALWTVFYLIASTMVAGLTSISAALGVAAFFGFCAMVVYGYDAWLKYQGVMSGQLAQGERHVNKTTSTVTSPAY